MKKFSNLLQKVRKSRKKTLGEVSAATGVPISTINNFELGKRGIDDDKLDVILRFLQAGIVDITPVEVEFSSSAPALSTAVPMSADARELKATYRLDALRYASEETLLQMLNAARAAADWRSVRTLADELAAREDEVHEKDASLQLNTTPFKQGGHRREPWKPPATEKKETKTEGATS